MTLSLRAKIIFICTAGIVAALGLNSVANAYIFSGRLAEALKARGSIVADDLGFQLERVLALGIPLDELVGFEEQTNGIIQKYPDVEHAFIVDASGKVHFHSGADIENVNEVSAYLNALSAQESAIVEYTKNGHSNIDFIRPVKNELGTVVGVSVVTVSNNIITDSLGRLQFFSVVTSLASIFLCLVFLFIALSQSITKPIHELVVVMQRITEQKDFSNDAPVHSRDEIGALATSFNALLALVRQSQEEVRQHATTLEKKVAERTRELEQMNALMIGRELKMKELKDKLSDIEEKMKASG